MTTAAPQRPAKLAREEDPRNPVARLTHLLDPGSLELITPDTVCGMLAARGTIEGAPVIAFCSDATVMGGAVIERDTTLLPLSLVLKEMNLPTAAYEGSPVEPVHGSTVPGANSSAESDDPARVPRAARVGVRTHPARSTTPID